MTVSRLLIFGTFLTSCAPTAIAQSNVSSVNKYGWGENVGWFNWRHDTPSLDDGAVVSAAYLSGFIWGENIGWVNVGNGPANGVTYVNADATDFGVNVEPSGELSGFAWGENVGWINFAGAPVPARLDEIGCRLDGFVWGENIGWLNLSSTEPAKFVAISALGDTDGDGVVGSLDFLALIATWGACPGPCPPHCSADFTGPASTPDCVVDALDLLTLIANWGTAPECTIVQ